MTEGEAGPRQRSIPPAVWLCAALLLAGGFAVVLLGEQSVRPVGRGGVAPDFELPLLAGNGSVALVDLRDKVVLLNFWATWCKPCEDEMPAMENLYRQLAPKGFELLAVSVDSDPQDVVAFRSRLGLSFPIAMDSQQQVARQYQTTGFPESLLIDREGRIVERYVGPRPWDADPYVERVRELLVP